MADHFLVSHFLFVDGVLLCGDGTIREWGASKGIIDQICLAIGMEIRNDKSSFLQNDVSPEVID